MVIPDEEFSVSFDIGAHPMKLAIIEDYVGRAASSVEGRIAEFTFPSTKERDSVLRNLWAIDHIRPKRTLP